MNNYSIANDPESRRTTSSQDREGTEDLRGLPFAERRLRLEAWYRTAARECFDLSPLIPFASWDELKALREAALGECLNLALPGNAACGE